jgi:uncharacterized protein
MTISRRLGEFRQRADQQPRDLNGSATGRAVQGAKILGRPRHQAPRSSSASAIELLAPGRRHFRGLCFAGATKRLRELLAEEPDRGQPRRSPRRTRVVLPVDDEEKAVEIAEFCPSARTDLPQSVRPPARAARRRGLDDAAALLEAAEK